MYRSCNRLFGLLIATSVIMSNPAAAGQTGFGENGLVTIDVPGFPDVNGVDIAIDHLDRIVVSGAVGDFFALFNTQEVAVARLLPDGSLDATFDDDGRAVTAFGGSSIHHRGGLAIDDLNRISIAAWTVNVSPGALDFGVARFTSDGTLDLAFDVDGHLTIAFPDADSHPDDLALAANGDAIVVGSGESRRRAGDGRTCTP